MHPDPYHAIHALFLRALVCDAEGRVLQATGAGAAHATIFDDPLLVSLHAPLRHALAGVPFEGTVQDEAGERFRIRAVPVVSEGPARLSVAVEPYVHPTDGLKDGLLDPSEVAFLVRNMRQGLWRLDPDDRIIEANDYIAAWLGTTVHHLIGTHAEDWRPDAEVSPRFEAEFTDRSGLKKRGLVIRSEMPSVSGQCRGSIELITDITSEHALKSKLVEEVRRMSHLARTDALTGLPNRMAFEERMAELRAANKPFALLVVDLDDLKAINDVQGHARGDEAIVEIGARLRETLRTTDIVARIGGDEFAAILPETSQDDAAMILERLRERLEHADPEHRIRASVGLAHSADGLDDVARSADDAMYRHKRSRKGGN